MNQKKIPIQCRCGGRANLRTENLGNFLPPSFICTDCGLTLALMKKHFCRGLDYWTYTNDSDFDWDALMEKERDE